MDETGLYPPIDPTNFDLIVIGTGLQESVIASAASAAGKTVLHLDPNPFYGGYFSSLNLDELSSFLHSHSPPPSPLPSPSSSNHAVVNLTSRPIFSAVEIFSHSPKPLESRKFNLDLAGPRVLFCAESTVDLLIKSGASQYMDFKGIDGNFICEGVGKSWSVPDSRSAIFRDSSLGLTEKTRLGNFFRLVEGHLKAVVGPDGDESNEGKRISEDDLEKPFVEFLDTMRLSKKMKSIILYAIAMADYDQDDRELHKHILKTKDGIHLLARYHSSVGRFSNALGAMIYPIYGQGELPQALCRRAAVKGCLYVLRMPVNALLMDKDNGNYRGIKVTSGQELFSKQLVLCPSMIVPNSALNPSREATRAQFKGLSLGCLNGKVARGICITNSSLKPTVTNLLMVYPPKSLSSDQVMSIRVLQIGSGSGVCPSGMFVSYLSSLCDDIAVGKRSLCAAISSLFSIHDFLTAENSDANESTSAEAKPTLLWSALYVQEIVTGSFDTISTTSTPDGNLSYDDIVDATKEQFFKMFPDEEFFPEKSFVDPEADAVLDQSLGGDSLDS